MKQCTTKEHQKSNKNNSNKSINTTPNTNTQQATKLKPQQTPPTKQNIKAIEKKTLRQVDIVQNNHSINTIKHHRKRSLVKQTK